jgi:hypothetical protein
MVKNKRKSVAPVVAEHHSRPSPPAAMAQEVDKTKVFGQTGGLARTADAGLKIRFDRRIFAETTCIKSGFRLNGRALRISIGGLACLLIGIPLLTTGPVPAGFPREGNR